MSWSQHIINQATYNMNIGIVKYVLLFGRWLEDFLNFAPDFMSPDAHNVEENVSVVNVKLEYMKYSEK